MAPNKAKKQKWQFPFLDHGLWSYSDEIRSANWYLVFAEDVPEAERAAVLEGVPPPAAGPVQWGGRVVLLESPPDRFFDSYVYRAYGPNPMADPLADDEPELSDADLATYDDDSVVTKREATAFVDAFDVWLAAVHERRPLTLVIAWQGSPKDAWSKWSVEQLPGRVIPELRALLAGLRPASVAEAREGVTPERLAGWVAWSAVATCVDLYDVKSLDEAQRADMVALVQAAKGYEDELDLKLNRILRFIAKASSAAT